MTFDVVMTCCRDEEDIIGTFVQYYLAAGFDHVHVVDNGSKDRSLDHVRALAAAGLPVSYEIDPRMAYERFLTDWYRAAGERWNPRWLFFLDCDEFILFPESAKSYLDSLRPEINRLRLFQKEIYPTEPPDPRPGGFLMSRRSEPQFSDMTKDMARWHPDAVVYGGKHRIDVPDMVTLDPEDIYIRHYKYRSDTQARRKEENRVASQDHYTDEDLARITAFSVERSRGWIDYCREALKEDGWRAAFAKDLPVTDDPVMAVRAAELLPTFTRFDEPAVSP